MIYDAAIQGVVKFNEVAGNFRGDPHKPNWEILDRQISLIQDELIELQETQEDDLQNAVKEAADVVVTALGFIHRAGYDPGKVMEVVNKSNMSKYTNNYLIAESTGDRYEELGVDFNFTQIQGLYCIKSNKDQVGSDSKSYPKGKVLKMDGYQEADLAGTEIEISWLDE